MQFWQGSVGRGRGNREGGEGREGGQGREERKGREGRGKEEEGIIAHKTPRFSRPAKVSELTLSTRLLDNRLK